MTDAKLEKIKRWILECRGKVNRHRDLEAIARALERVAVKRGNHPTYQSTAFPDANVITIPNHAGKAIKKGTAASILNQLEEDVTRFEAKLAKEKSQSQRGPVQYDESGYKH